MNSLTVAGNVVRDAELRHTASGDAVLSFAVADNAGKDKPAIFWNCSLFGRRAEALAPHITRGQSVTIAGTVTEREWTDKNGQQRKSMDVRVQEVALQGGKRDGAPRQERPQQSAPRQQQRPPADDPFGPMDDDIQF